MIPGMILREEDSDPLDGFRGICWGLMLSLIAWAMGFLAIAGLVNAL